MRNCGDAPLGGQRLVIPVSDFPPDRKPWFTCRPCPAPWDSAAQTSNRLGSFRMLSISLTDERLTCDRKVTSISRVPAVARNTINGNASIEPNAGFVTPVTQVEKVQLTPYMN